MDYEHLKHMRQFEIQAVLGLMSSGHTVLELGAGAGWQAEVMTAHGLHVIAVDLEASNYRHVQTWPVICYDGYHLPFGDAALDIIFSSNVLEHIPHIDSFQAELRRVLKPDGLAIHLLPTSSWRFWTNLTYYVVIIARLIYTFLWRFLDKISASTPLDLSSRLRKPLTPISQILEKLFSLPPLHGEFGNVISETYYFSHLRWSKHFQNNGWQIISRRPNRLFYTGYFLLGRWLPISLRHKLSYLLGSACMIYVLKPASNSTDKP